MATDRRITHHELLALAGIAGPGECRCPLRHLGGYWFADLAWFHKTLVRVEVSVCDVCELVIETGPNYSNSYCYPYHQNVRKRKED